MTEPTTRAPRCAYAGLFFVAMATLAFEILLTRIFSVTTWYHFAFMAVSVGMFGMTAGAISVYLRPRTFATDVSRRMATAGIAFAWAIPAALLGHLAIPFDDEPTPVGIFSLALTYLIVSVPFYFSGVAVCLALTRFPRQVNRLYAADLAGAGIGCILLLVVLQQVGDGPSAVLVVAAVAALGALLFALPSRRLPVVALAALTCIGLGTVAVWHVDRANQGTAPIKVKWVKGDAAPQTLYERWNSFSRITVIPWFDIPFGWGFGKKIDYRSMKIEQHGLRIDAQAATVITKFDGDTSKVDYLRTDLTNFAHYLRQDAKVLVVGTGGGRDILSGLVFDQREIVGVEMNGDILRTVNEVYGDFTGHLDRHPKIRFVNDEARSFIARTDERFDILQISLIDTWAATTAGAFVLAENALYTAEAWQVFLDKLTDRGVLTTSRWYRPPHPAEVWRMVSLGAATLRARGVANPAAHMAVVSNDGAGAANLIVGKQPLGDDDLATLRREAETYGFKLLLAGGESEDPVMARLARGEDAGDLPDGLRLDLSPPTDDRPFFFNVIRFEDLIRGRVPEHKMLEPNLKAVQILGVLLCIVTVLTLLCIVMPLALTTDRADVRGSMPLMLFFAAIGLGFLLVELSQMHRLVLLLGHPVYGLSVVLFALLLSSGLGSFLGQRIGDPRRRGPLVLLGVLVVLGLFGLVTEPLAHAVQSWSTPLRITVAVASLFPLGILLGMAFPLGIQVAADRSPKLLAWFWGINGATSVLASVLSTGIALTFSISTAYWAGASCYVVALLAFLWARTGLAPAGREVEVEDFDYPDDVMNSA